MCNNLFKHLTDNNLIPENRSSFKPWESCINKILSFTHDIYKRFDQGFKLRGVFRGISKAFDKVCYEGIIFKLKQNGISGKPLRIT